MTDKQELLSCPFCGGSPTLERSANRGGDPGALTGMAIILCDTARCPCHIGGEWQLEAKAIAAWNRRTPDPELAKVTAERDEARETARRLNREKQQLESLIADEQRMVVEASGPGAGLGFAEHFLRAHRAHVAEKNRADAAESDRDSRMGFSETCRPRRSSGPSIGHQDMNGSIRKRLEAALAKPLPEGGEMIHSEVFSPWQDVISGIDGGYSSESDDLMIAVLEAIRDSTTFELIELRGFAAELALYVLSGHGFTQYGTSPRGAWPRHEIEDLWQPLIDKWIAYRVIAWDEA